MLSVTLLCVGKMKEPYYIAAFDEYRKRLSAYCKISVSELPEQRLPEDPSPREISAALEKEGAEITKHIPSQAAVIALCVEGKQMSSSAFSQMLERRALEGTSKLCFLVGGSFGLSETVKRRADVRLSLSEMTFPHHLARVMLIEQLYRAFTIQAGGRYHK